MVQDVSTFHHYMFLLQNQCYILEQQFKQIHVCGLDGDFQKKKFGQILDLIPHCDSVTKLKAICKACPIGQRALFSFRITNENEQTCVGLNNYKSLCRQCYPKNITSFNI